MNKVFYVPLMAFIVIGTLVSLTFHHFNSNTPARTPWSDEWAQDFETHAP
jgi:hypothetical protein